MDVNLFISANLQRSINSGAQPHGSAEGVAEVQLCAISAFALCSKGILIADVVLRQLTQLRARFLFQQATSHELLGEVGKGMPVVESAHYYGLNCVLPKCVCGIPNPQDFRM